MTFAPSRVLKRGLRRRHPMGSLRWAAGMAGAAGLACGGPIGPTVASVAGTYNAVEFTITGITGEPVDYLAVGGSVMLTLHADGASDGKFEMTAGSFSVPLGGVWTLTDSTVVVQIDTEEYPGDLTFRVGDNELTGGGGWSDAYLSLRLGKAPGAV